MTFFLHCQVCEIRKSLFGVLVQLAPSGKFERNDRKKYRKKERKDERMNDKVVGFLLLEVLDSSFHSFCHSSQIFQSQSSSWSLNVVL